MSDLVRLSLSIESSLLEKMEQMAEAKGYVNRSEFIRDIIREQLIRTEWAHIFFRQPLKRLSFYALAFLLPVNGSMYSLMLI